jgi:hypothetical protein
MRGRVALWLDAHLDPEWRNFQKLHSVQMAAVLAVAEGAWVAVPAFQNFVPPVTFLIICCFFSVSIMGLRLTMQSNVPVPDVTVVKGDKL